jgi:DNA-binding response OmpR family regulator
LFSTKDCFRKNRFLVDYYYNPILAIDEFKSNFYDLIKLDIQMPEINGLQLYREIKKGIQRQKYVLSVPVNLYLILHTRFLLYILLLKNL